MTTNQKGAIISLVSAIALIIIVLVGCSMNNKEKSNDVTGTITVLSREDGSGTRDAFVELMEIVDENNNDDIVNTAEITNSTSVMISTINGNKKAIGYVSLGSMSADVKSVSIDGVNATADMIKDGSYMLQRPFNIAYKEDKISDVSNDFIKFIMSKDGQKIINSHGYVEIDTDEKYTSINANGTITIAGSTSVAPVMNTLADKYKELNPNVTIEIQESGSSAGIESALSDTVEIAMSSRELNEDEAKQLKSTKIAIDGIAVIVNNNNGIDDLSAKQIRSIFSGEITKWEELKND